jgi:predicted RNase H-like HicB family nuclease
VKSFVFRVELDQDDDGRWSAVVPALPGCAAWGYTPAEAVEAAREAAQAYIEVLVEDGRPVPSAIEDGTQVIDGPAVAVIA